MTALKILKDIIYINQIEVRILTYCLKSFPINPLDLHNKHRKLDWNDAPKITLHLIYRYTVRSHDSLNLAL